MIINILVYFIVGAIAGWLLECIYKLVTKNLKYTPGILSGPFCILYGCGVCAISVFVPYISKNIALTYALCTVILTLFEYMTYDLLDSIYGIRLWDYSKLKGSISAKICLQFSVCWGIFGTAYIYLVLPHINYYIVNASKEFVAIFAYILFTIIFIDLIASSRKILIKRTFKKQLQ